MGRLFVVVTGAIYLFVGESGGEQFVDALVADASPTLILIRRELLAAPGTSRQTSGGVRIGV
jgi:hypothetical protein